MRYLVMFLLTVSLCMFTLGCGGDKDKTKNKEKEKGKTPAGEKTE